MLYNYTADLTRKNAPNQADNIVIFRSCLLPKMRLSVVLEGRYISRLLKTLTVKPEEGGVKQPAKSNQNILIVSNDFA